MSTRFYSESVDAEISKLESVIGPLINNLRQTEIGTAVDPECAETLIVHLGMRSGFVRSELERMLTELLAGVAQRNRDPQFMTGIIDNVENPGFGEGLLDFIQVKLRELPASDQTEETRAWAGDRKTLADRLRQANAMPSDFTDSLNNVLATMGAVLDVIARNVHLQLVSDTFGARGRVPALTSFHWTIERAGNNGLILPDCIAVWINEEDQSQPYIFSTFADAPIVLLPIAADRFLFGRRGRASAPPLHELNLHLSACARTLFVAHPACFDAEHVAPRLGIVRNGLDEALGPALSYVGPHTAVDV